MLLPHRRLLLRAIQAGDRARLRVLARRHPGVEIHPEASSNLASARITLGHGARLRIGAGVATERAAGALRLWVGDGAELVVDDDTWLRVETGPLSLYALAGARLHVGRDGFLSACSITAKREVVLGRQVWVGPGSQIDYSWVATAVTVLRGVAIGAHSVVGARSLVTRSIPDHTLAFGSPAVPRGKVGDRAGLRA